MGRNLEKKLLFIPLLNIFVYIYLLIIITIPRIIIRNIFHNEIVDLVLFGINIWLCFIVANLCLLYFEKRENNRKSDSKQV